ncbi:hypothetical protein K443DRAFT_118091 [Laccaria amethystina LaAM-08-1]|uniref:Uncharacterized protein n=1 Tax=Laccaria amethystina LaAM-08-1 TaxID=1095629 RepID=A0A0C9YIA9_9AGAR|nr:hypothetical protein K443DRAFT_118091 [Laccaria amethystina LaAM-08-1]
MMEWSLPWPSQDEGILVAIVTFVIKSLSTAAGPFEVMDAVTNLGPKKGPDASDWQTLSPDLIRWLPRGISRYIRTSRVHNYIQNYTHRSRQEKKGCKFHKLLGQLQGHVTPNF